VNQRLTCFGALLLALLTRVASVDAATYYVDSEAGNDAWTGLVGTVTTTGTGQVDGPWQSLVRASRTAMQPGDQILLRCGRSWSETLRVSGRGTAGSPIRVGAYPTGCTTKPLIDGAINVPGHAWTLEQGGTYGTSIPFNLVENGRLDTSIARWNRWSPAGDASISLSSSCPGGGRCLLLTSSASNWSLINSPSFPVTASITYRVQFSLRAPAGASLNALVRRAGPTYGSLSPEIRVTGTGAWQDVVFDFAPTASTPNARFDIYVPGTRQEVFVRSVSVLPLIIGPSHLTMPDREVAPAHHPNVGHNAGEPDSIYLLNAVDSNRVATTTGQGSTYVTVGTDLRLPAGAVLAPGIDVHVRSAPWVFEPRRVTAVSSGRLSFQTPTSLPTLAGHGYFLTGARWMLDSPDEWHYDGSSGRLRVWMPDSAAPGNRLSYSILYTAIDLTNASDITLEGLAVRGAVNGVVMRGATRVTVRGFSIENVAEEGIDARLSVDSVIDDCLIARSGLEAIAGGDDLGRYSRNLTVMNSDVRWSGVQRVGTTVTTIPRPSMAGITGGTAAVVRGNRVHGAAYLGIRVYGTGRIEDNAVSEVCLVFDDCGGIYVHNSSSGAVVARNLVQGVHGNRSGTLKESTHGVGIYLDILTHSATVTGNTIVDADYGMQIHNAFNNTVSQNTFFGNRFAQLWFQEQSRQLRTDGDIYGNAIQRNVFFPASAGVSIIQQSYLGSTHDFATFSGNTYYALWTPQIVSDDPNDQARLYTFDEWRAMTVNGVPRRSDLDGRAITAFEYASYSVVPGNLVPNGGFANGATDWTFWNQTAPFGRLTVEACPFGPCGRFVAGASTSLLSSPNFSVRKDQLYRVSFDARVGRAGQRITALVRRGGGGANGYEALMAKSESYNGSTGWTRYAFTFRSLATVNAADAATGDLGARLDFTGIAAADTLQVANVEMVTMNSVDAGGLVTAILTNLDPKAGAQRDCPERTTNPALCALYVRASDGAPMAWPYFLPALGKEIIYTQNRALLDTDRDGIPNSQDRCPASPAGQAVRSDGCAMGQTPQ